MVDPCWSDIQAWVRTPVLVLASLPMPSLFTHALALTDRLVIFACSISYFVAPIFGKQYADGPAQWHPAKASPIHFRLLYTA